METAVAGIAVKDKGMITISRKNGTTIVKFIAKNFVTNFFILRDILNAIEIAKGIIAQYIIVILSH